MTVWQRCVCRVGVPRRIRRFGERLVYLLLFSVYEVVLLEGGRMVVGVDSWGVTGVLGETITCSFVVDFVGLL
jgi:hypothetical protein